MGFAIDCDWLAENTNSSPRTVLSVASIAKHLQRDSILYISYLSIGSINSVIVNMTRALRSMSMPTVSYLPQSSATRSIIRSVSQSYDEIYLEYGYGDPGWVNN